MAVAASNPARTGTASSSAFLELKTLMVRVHVQKWWQSTVCEKLLCHRGVCAAMLRVPLPVPILLEQIRVLQSYRPHGTNLNGSSDGWTTNRLVGKKPQQSYFGGWWCIGNSAWKLGHGGGRIFDFCGNIKEKIRHKKGAKERLSNQQRAIAGAFATQHLTMLVLPVWNPLV
jgi:hypothetical protein